MGTYSPRLLFSPCPGRSLDQLHSALGWIVEKQANCTAHSMGLGPYVVPQKIKLYFGSGQERAQRLEPLRNSIPPKLAKQCRNFVKFTLPTESGDTQCQVFKDIVDLVTSFPGLRVLFFRAERLDNATSIDAISALWGRSTGFPGEECFFLANFLYHDDLTTFVQCNISDHEEGRA
ncbi:hypothetical protein MVEN_00204600 [Mycena venus]|uniref:Uncharacterized protein n=1 Tax=Mycena venus TaxID=2733690 RepID=A0A8H6Z3U3_9AGAR|nr:hypothetical protein MVEN_00204600 [Mycena venus]